ncbi:hypothetical protein [Streptomyces sp. NPDC048200]|uniref:hypothetical protein n=1 Tax=Streptomyces sp. NPDC048200 TaxID=3365512 RepID=UPI003721D0C4
MRDLVRRSDAWHGCPDLLAAFFAGYGRLLTPAEQAGLVVDAALDSVGGIAYGSAHGGPKLVERGRRTLARLLAPMTVQGLWLAGLRPNAFTA